MPTSPKHLGGIPVALACDNIFVTQSDNQRVSEAVGVAMRWFGDAIFKFALNCELSDGDWWPAGKAEQDRIEELARHLLSTVAADPNQLGIDGALIELRESDHNRLLSLTNHVDSREAAVDDFEAELVRLAVEWYPRLLLQLGLGALGHSFVSSGEREPRAFLAAVIPSERNERLLALLASTTDLGLRLDPDEPIGSQHIETSNWAYDSKLHLGGLAGSLFVSGFKRSRIFGPPTLAGFVDAVKTETERAVRTLGGVDQSSALFVFRGIALPKGSTHRLGDLELVPWREEVGVLVPVGWIPAWGEEGSPALIIELAAPQHAKRVGAVGGDYSERIASRRRVFKQLELDLVTSALLAFGRDELASVRQIAQTSLDAIAQNTLQLGAQWTAEFPTFATSSEVAEWSERFEQVVNTPVTTGSIALRRIERAILHRNDPADQIVDCVIAWENLFGTGQGEIAFGISLSIARILGSSEAERTSIQKTVKKFYTLRSRIVHGADPGQDCGEQAQQVLVITRDILGRIFSDYPEFLSAKSDKKPGLVAGLLLSNGAD